MLSLFLGSRSELLCWNFLGKNTGILVFADGCLETQGQMRLDIPMSKDQWDDFTPKIDLVPMSEVKKNAAKNGLNKKSWNVIILPL